MSEDVSKIPLDELFKTQPEHLVDSSKSSKNSQKKQPKPARRKTPQEKALLNSLDLDNKSKEKAIERDEADHKQIVRLRWILGMSGLAIVVVWQSAILCLVWHQGLGRISIPIPVLLALITTTTVNVFGFLIIVMKFVFANTNSLRNKQNSKQSKQQ